MEQDQTFAEEPREWTEQQWKDMEENAIVQIRFADGTAMTLDAERRDEHFREGGDEEIVSEARFAYVRHELVGEGEQARLELTGVNADGYRVVIGGMEDGRVVDEPERDTPLREQMAELVRTAREVFGRDRDEPQREVEHGR
jgi:hypothetical protein